LPTSILSYGRIGKSSHIERIKPWSPLLSAYQQ
jgi:hypothetical protein